MNGLWRFCCRPCLIFGCKEPFPLGLIHFGLDHGVCEICSLLRGHCDEDWACGLRALWNAESWMSSNAEWVKAAAEVGRKAEPVVVQPLSSILAAEAAEWRGPFHESRLVEASLMARILGEIGGIFLHIFAAAGKVASARRGRYCLGTPSLRL